VNPDNANHLSLVAVIAELSALRYTPAGVPALDLLLEHESRVQEAGQERQVAASVKAVAFGVLAERLARQAIGSRWKFQGFLASPRQRRSLVFHIQEFDA
jgi:primosomal replication protein N